MNKRQAKKKDMNQYLLCNSYSKNRKAIRRQHERSVSLARLQHRNFWEEWKRGYPNRFPYMKWFDSM